MAPSSVELADGRSKPVTEVYDNGYWKCPWCHTPQRGSSCDNPGCLSQLSLDALQHKEAQYAQQKAEEEERKRAMQVWGSSLSRNPNYNAAGKSYTDIGMAQTGPEEYGAQDMNQLMLTSGRKNPMARWEHTGNKSLRLIDPSGAEYGNVIASLNWKGKYEYLAEAGSTRKLFPSQKDAKLWVEGRNSVTRGITQENPRSSSMKRNPRTSTRARTKSSAKPRYGVYVKDNLAYVSTKKLDANKAASKLKLSGRAYIKIKQVNANPVSGKMPKVGWRDQYKKAAYAAIKAPAKRRAAATATAQIRRTLARTDQFSDQVLGDTVGMVGRMTNPADYKLRPTSTHKWKVVEEPRSGGKYTVGYFRTNADAQNWIDQYSSSGSSNYYVVGSGSRRSNPKFVGEDIPGAQEIEDNANADYPTRIHLTYSQAKRLPSYMVMKSLDTTDRGSRGTYAKRWYRWFASADSILNSDRSTKNMLERAQRGTSIGRAGHSIMRSNPGGTMSRRRNGAIEQTELELFADSTSSLNRQRESILKNLTTKEAQGKYNAAKAAKLWQYWVDAAAKQYNKEFGSGTLSLKDAPFTAADRRAVAKTFEQNYRDALKSGEYLHYAPKKYGGRARAVNPRRRSNPSRAQIASSNAAKKRFAVYVGDTAAYIGKLKSAANKAANDLMDRGRSKVQIYEVLTTSKIKDGWRKAFVN